MTEKELRDTVSTLKTIIDAMALDLEYAIAVSDQIEEFDVDDFDNMGIRLQALHEIML